MRNLILDLREQYKLGTWGIKRNNVKTLDLATTRRALGTRRYSKEVPGHHVQVMLNF